MHIVSVNKRCTKGLQPLVGHFGVHCPVIQTIDNLKDSSHPLTLGN